MGRPKLKEKDRKKSISLTFTPEIHKLMKDVKNKSQFIEILIKKYYNNNK